MVFDQQEIKNAHLIESGHSKVQGHQDFFSVKKCLSEPLELLHDRITALLGSYHVSALDSFNEPTIDVPHFDHVVREVWPVDHLGRILLRLSIQMNRSLPLFHLNFIVLMSLHVLRLMLAIISLLPPNVIGYLNYITFLAERIPISTLPSITAKIGIEILILHLYLVRH